MYYNVRLRCLHVDFVLRVASHILIWPNIWPKIPHCVNTLH